MKSDWVVHVTINRNNYYFWQPIIIIIIILRISLKLYYDIKKKKSCFHAPTVIS